MPAPQPPLFTPLSGPYFNHSGSRSSSVDRYPAGGSKRSSTSPNNGFLQDGGRSKISDSLLKLDSRLHTQAPPSIVLAQILVIVVQQMVPSGPIRLQTTVSSRIAMEVRFHVRSSGFTADPTFRPLFSFEFSRPLSSRWFPAVLYAFRQRFPPRSWRG